MPREQRSWQKCICHSDREAGCEAGIRQADTVDRQTRRVERKTGRWRQPGRLRRGQTDRQADKRTNGQADREEGKRIVRLTKI